MNFFWEYFVHCCWCLGSYFHFWGASHCDHCEGFGSVLMSWLLQWTAFSLPLPTGCWIFPLLVHLMPHPRTTSFQTTIRLAFHIASACLGQEVHWLCHWWIVSLKDPLLQFNVSFSQVDLRYQQLWLHYNMDPMALFVTFFFATSANQPTKRPSGINAEW